MTRTPDAVQPDEDRIRGIVLQILRARLRQEELQGVVLAAPPCPEASLLERWLAPELRVHRPDPVQVAALAEILEAEAWEAAAHRLARQARLLPIHPAHKLWLLVDPPRGACFPLGDLWPIEIRRFAGESTVPSPLARLPAEIVARVEEALREGLDGGLGCSRALIALEQDVREVVLAGLARSRQRLGPPLVPKLTAWTPGMDPSH